MGYIKNDDISSYILFCIWLNSNVCSVVYSFKAWGICYLQILHAPHATFLSSSFYLSIFALNINLHAVIFDFLNNTFLVQIQLHINLT